MQIFMSTDNAITMVVEHVNVNKEGTRARGAELAPFKIAMAHTGNGLGVALTMHLFKKEARALIKALQEHVDEE